VSWHSSEKANKPRCRVRPLRRYLIEIVALTLDADFNLLNEAIYNERAQEKTNSVLSTQEQQVLFASSSLASQAYKHHAQKHSTSEFDQQRLRHEIIEPVCDIGMLLMSLDALDLIAWYGEPMTMGRNHSRVLDPESRRIQNDTFDKVFLRRA
jgi:hypothetical protein